MGWLFDDPGFPSSFPLSFDAADPSFETFSGAPFRWSRNHCWPIWIAFDVVQYTTRPAGKMNPQNPNSSGMNRINACC